MKLTKQHIENIARSLGDFLDSNKINSLESLKTYVGKSFPLSQDTWIEVSLGPSNAGTKAYTLSYVWQGVGIPLEARINSELEYTQVILKLGDTVEKYTPFAGDRKGNVMQFRYLNSAEIPRLAEELSRLEKNLKLFKPSKR